MEKDYLPILFGRRDLIILRSGEMLSKFRKLMIMRREKRLLGMLRRVVQLFCNGPGDRQPVEGRGTAADLI